MEPSDDVAIAQLSDEMLRFTPQPSSASECAARLGRLTFGGGRRPAISTPHYIVSTSRGAVPHLSQDNLQKHTKISAVYVPLEDFIEKSPAGAPIFKTQVRDGESPLGRYIGLPEQCVSILGSRRVPNIPCPSHNTNSAVAISTSVGFRFLEAGQYHSAIKALRADVSTSLADVPQIETASSRRLAKSADRTHAWLRDYVESKREGDSSPLFASIPPLEPGLLRTYLSDLKDEYRTHISGLCIYSPATATSLPPDLQSLPTIYLGDPATPHAVLAAIHAGIDLVNVPFVTQCSEHGIALSFSFPGSSTSLDQPMGIDLWSPDHTSDTSPLSPGCACYACKRHHRAYVHHLLQANEMLAWTLLQIHNHGVIEAFFAAIRASIERAAFAEDLRTFARAYAPDLPRQTGPGPRIRGYQMKSVGGGEPRKNPRAYGKLDDRVQKLAEAESGVATPEGGAEEIEAHGLAKRVVEE